MLARDRKDSKVSIGLRKGDQKKGGGGEKAGLRFNKLIQDFEAGGEFK